MRVINRAGRDIPEEILEIYQKTVYQGMNYRDNVPYKKSAPVVRSVNDPQRSKLLGSIREALERCGVRDGMYFGFHHHFRDGDYIINMVMDEVAKMGIKDITICASSLGAAHDPVDQLVDQGVVGSLQSSGVRGKIGEAISHGKLARPAIIRSHGGRVRAIEEGDIHLDIAFIGAPTCDEYGNARAIGGKSDCGVLSYSMVDAKYADKVVVITDCLVPFPNVPASISMTDVDYVVEVEEIGNPKKIVSNVIRVTKDVRELMMADYCAKIIAASPYFKDGFSFQTGGGGAALAVTGLLHPIMKQRNIRMGFAIGGIMQAMCDLMDAGLIRKIVDAQVFDAGAIEHIRTNPNHIEISTSEYANPMNKGAYVNKLDFVILGALEVDTHFHVNVVTGSDGIVRGAPGGHPDTAAGAKCSIIVAPLIRSRIPTIVDHVLTVTTPGEAVDIVVTDYGIAINPRRQDLLDIYKNSGLPLRTIEELRDLAYSIVGRPAPVVFDEKIVAVVESRDGTILDVIRKVHRG